MNWMDGWKLGASLWSNGVALQQTLLASYAVIGHRKTIIDEAIRRPLDADLVELHRMGAEKVEAFGKAGSTLLDAWLGMQGALIAQGCDLMLAGASGRVPVKRMTRRASKLAVKASKAGEQALAPVRKAATANRRRLDRSRRGPRR